MSGIPDYALETTFDFKFTTRAFASGVPTTLAGTPAVEIYEDNSVTQITAAETLTADFDSVTGLNNLRIAATAANGFESGKSYAAVISTGTVGGVSVVGEVLLNFSIERTSALRPSTAGRTLGVEADGDLTKVNTLHGHTPQTADHTAGIADIPTVGEFEARTLLAASYFDPATDTVANVGTVATLTGHTPQTADHTAAIADIPTVAEFNARTLAAAAYFDPVADAVANVTTVATLTGHTPQTADHAAAIADIPTVAEFNARTLAAAAYFDSAADTVATVTTVTNQVTADAVAISGSTDAADKLEESAETMILAQATGGTTTTITTTDITEATADHLNGRIVIFRDGTLSKQATDITDYSFSGGTATLTVTALTEAPTTENFIVV